MQTVIDAARAYLAAGLGVIPIRADGSKAAACRWAQYQDRHATDAELAEWFGGSRAVGIGVVCGRVSGNLAVLDFESESAWAAWLARAESEGFGVAVAACPLARTPRGGRHLYCRIDGEWRAGERLAASEGGACLIETRGQGHYVLAPGSPGACHPTNAPYLWEREAWGAPLAPATYDAWCDIAREQNEYVPPERVREPAPSSAVAVAGDRPGDRYNAVARWADILTPHGWRVAYTSGEATYWTRPGKQAGVSASTGKCRSAASGDLLYVFSTGAPPFEGGACYSKYAARAMLDFAGNFSECARALAAETAPPPSAIDWSQRAASNPDGRGFKWSSELRANDTEEDWIWRGYLARGGTALLSAHAKAGKTTLLRHFLRASAAGGEFLGQPLRACKVLYVSEESERNWVRARDGLGLADNIGYYLQPFKVRPTSAIWEAFVGALAGDVAKHGFDLVVFDTLAKLWPVVEENNAGAVDSALMPLWTIAKTGAAVLLVHHLRKSGGQEYTGSRGSGALTAFPDILIELTRFDASNDADRRRSVKAKGRYDETPVGEVTIELDAARNEYMILHSVAPMRSEAQREIDGDDLGAAIVAVVDDAGADGASYSRIARELSERGVQYRRANLAPALVSLLTARRLAKSDDGEYRLFTADDPGEPANHDYGD